MCWGTKGYLQQFSLMNIMIWYFSNADIPFLANLWILGHNCVSSIWYRPVFHKCIQPSNDKHISYVTSELKSWAAWCLMCVAHRIFLWNIKFTVTRTISNKYLDMGCIACTKHDENYQDAILVLPLLWNLSICGIYYKNHVPFNCCILIDIWNNIRFLYP